MLLNLCARVNRQCTNGEWEDIDDGACPKRCIMSGETHVITFDGKDYDFSGSCTYVMARDVARSAFEILVTNVMCGATGVSCQKSVTIRARDADLSWNEYKLETVQNAARILS